MPQDSVSSADFASYEYALALATRVRSLYDRVAEARVFLRSPEPLSKSLRPPHHGSLVPHVERDAVVLALLNKAASTFEAVSLLCEAGYGDAAYALARVIMESAVLLDWLALDPVYRIDQYQLSSELLKRRWTSVLELHADGDQELLAQVAAWREQPSLAWADIFGDTHHKWARKQKADGTTEHVSLADMFIETAKAVTGRELSFARDAMYFRASDFVHSTSLSLQEHLGRTRAQRTMHVGPAQSPSTRAEALMVASMMMGACLAALERYAQVELDGEVAALLAALTADSKRSVAPLSPLASRDDLP